VPVTNIVVDLESHSLPIGQTVKLSATLVPANATNQGVIWTSGDDNVATVNNAGLVTAVSTGTATITAKSSDGSFTDTALITVVSATSNLVLNPEFDLGTSNW